MEPSLTESALLVEPGRIEGMVDVGGRSLYIRCVGEGSPTIILESGVRMYLDWGRNSFFSDLTEITRTCQYDRANLGESDPAPTPRTAQDMVNDLHTMLINAQISGPYVLVSQDIGGWIASLYAGQYPEEVAGMVLLDSFHPDQGLRFSEVFPAETPNEPSLLTSERNYWASFYEEGISDDPEGWDLLNSAEQVRAVTSLGDIHLVVLYAKDSYWGNMNWLNASPDSSYKNTPEKNQIMNETWYSMQRELAILSSDGWQEVCNSINYCLGTPDKVISKVNSIMREVQAAQP
jgi:pimeloyl-ACP methyl ester carboxylesterase